MRLLAATACLSIFAMRFGPATTRAGEDQGQLYRDVAQRIEEAERKRDECEREVALDLLSHRARQLTCVSGAAEWKDHCALRFTWLVFPAEIQCHRLVSRPAVREGAGKPGGGYMGEPASREGPNNQVGANGTDQLGPILGYLTCPQDAANSYLGAIMVTDCRTRPLYFGFVQPVRPTQFQRILYGRTLEEHVKIEVIAKKLIQELPQRPAILFVDAKDLLVVRRLTPIPVAHLYKGSAAPEDGVRLSPLVFDAGDSPEDHEAAGIIIAKLECQVDLVDPFARILDAMKEGIRATANRRINGEDS